MMDAVVAVKPCKDHPMSYLPRRLSGRANEPMPTPNLQMAKALPSAPPKSPTVQPQLPHDRDEKAGSTDGVPSERVRQGARDLKRGLQDTSRSTESDAAYRKLKR